MPQSSEAQVRPRYHVGMSRIQTAEAWLDRFMFSTESDPILKRAGITRAKLRAIETDDEVSQCKGTFTDAVVNVPWRLEPNQTRAAKRITGILTPWAPKIIRSMVDAVSYGYSVVQLNWDQPDGLVGIASAWQCPLEWFTPTYTGDLLAARPIYFDDGKIAASEGESVLEKFPGMYFHVVRDGSYINPMGDALLSRIYYPVTWRRQGWGLWLGYLETFAQPIIIAETGNYNDFIDAMKAQGMRSVVGYQGETESKITTISGAQAGEFERLEQALIDRIQRLYLGQTFSSGIRTGGSYAAGKALELVRQDKKVSAVRLITPVMQRIVDTIASLNGLPTCTFVMSDNTGLELDRAERDAKILPVLSASGLMLSNDYFLDRYDYTDTDVIPLSGINNDQQSTPTGFAKLSAGNIDPFRQAIDEYVDTAVKLQPTPINIDELRKVIVEAKDKSDLERRLTVFLKKGTKEFDDLLEKAAFACRVIGYVSGDETQ